MPQWEYLILSILFGDNDMVRSVSYNGMTLFRSTKWTVVLHYIEDLKSNGWEIVNVHPTESGEIYELKRLVE